MTTQSTAPALLVKPLESTLFLVRDGSPAAAFVAPETASRPETSRVIHIAFGEWPDPTFDHPDSMSVRDFVATLESAGFGDSIQNGRREIASWMDSKTTLRSLRLAAGLSQEQLAAAMDTSQSQIARIESRRQDVSLSTMERLAEALKIDIHSVVDAARG